MARTRTRKGEEEMRKAAAYAAAVMAGLAIMVLGMALVVTFQIHLWLLPVDLECEKVNPLFTFPPVVYEVAVATLAMLAGIFLAFAALLRR